MVRTLNTFDRDVTTDIPMNGTLPNPGYTIGRIPLVENATSLIPFERIFGINGPTEGT